VPTIDEVANSVPQISRTDKLLGHRNANPQGAPADQPDEQILEFTPRQIDRHRASTKLLRCACFYDRLECQFGTANVLFDDDPSRYFSVDVGVSDAAGLEIERLYRTRKMTFASGTDPAELENKWIVYIAKDGENYRLVVSDSNPDSGCSTWPIVALRRNGEAPSLEVLEITTVCI